MVQIEIKPSRSSKAVVSTLLNIGQSTLAKGEAMKRRDFIQGSAVLLATGVAARLLSPNAALAADGPAPTEELLSGAIPSDASAATSSLFKFAHHHFLFIPKPILMSPPEAGWNTYTSRIIPTLGIDPEEIKIKKERHFHEVAFSKKQLEMIRDSQMVVLDITSGATVVHQFLFNGPKSFGEQITDFQKIAKTQGLLTKLS
jgi:hypothetical protein